jgi:hypothetical protein
LTKESPGQQWSQARRWSRLLPFAVGVAWLSRLGQGSGYASAVLPQIVIIGLGVGLAVPFNIIILSSAAPEDTGVTAGIVRVSITVGGLIGIAVFLLPFSQGASTEAEHFARVSPGSPR